jgi:putative NADH-flavin reductase
MRIAVIGAGGWLGGDIAGEALARGHEVTAIGRNAGKLQDIDEADVREYDATQAEGLGDNGERLLDQPGFPQEYLAEAQAGLEALELLRAAPARLDWTYLSPPPENLTPGEKRGGYSVAANDRPVVDASGRSAITSGDLASALVDELEQPQFSRRRFTVGYTSA